MDGYEASEKILEILKNDNNLDYCHIVALTSYTGMDVRQRCLSIGMKEMKTGSKIRKLNLPVDLAGESVTSKSLEPMRTSFELVTPEPRSE